MARLHLPLTQGKEASKKSIYYQTTACIIIAALCLTQCSQSYGQLYEEKPIRCETAYRSLQKTPPAPAIPQIPLENPTSPKETAVLSNQDLGGILLLFIQIIWIATISLIFWEDIQKTTDDAEKVNLLENYAETLSTHTLGLISKERFIELFINLYLSQDAKKETITPLHQTPKSPQPTDTSSSRVKREEQSPRPFATPEKEIKDPPQSDEKKGTSSENQGPEQKKEALPPPQLLKESAPIIAPETVPVPEHQITIEQKTPIVPPQTQEEPKINPETIPLVPVSAPVPKPEEKITPPPPEAPQAPKEAPRPVIQELVLLDQGRVTTVQIKLKEIAEKDLKKIDQYSPIIPWLRENTLIEEFKCRKNSPKWNDIKSVLMSICSQGTNRKRIFPLLTQMINSLILPQHQQKLTFLLSGLHPWMQKHIPQSRTITNTYDRYETKLALLFTKLQEYIAADYSPQLQMFTQKIQQLYAYDADTVRAFATALAHLADTYTLTNPIPQQAIQESLALYQGPNKAELENLLVYLTTPQGSLHHSPLLMIVNLLGPTTLFYNDVGMTYD